MASNGTSLPIRNGDAKPLNRADEVDDVSGSIFMAQKFIDAPFLTLKI
jgi:hypothetical protein